MPASNRITNVAIIGASGNSGKFMTEALLKTGKHVITAITRTDSTSPFPEGVKVKKVDYSKPETLVEALKGQDALVVTLGGFAPKEVYDVISHAAATAGVGWVLPNEWSPDTAHEGLVKDVPIFHSKIDTRKTIAELGKSNYIAVNTGFWYEWSLAIPSAFGIDLINHAATLFDDGETKISISTWPQVGRAVAALLSLPIAPEEGTKACLEDFANKIIYVNSFTVSQKEMLDSALRVTGTKIEDWKIEHEGSKERFDAGVEQMKKGDKIGFAKMLYTRVFFPDGNGDFEKSKGTSNEALGLEKESVDEATQRALERAKTTEAWA